MIWLILMTVGVFTVYCLVDKVSDNLNPYNFDRK